MADESKAIKYSYISHEYSPGAVTHAFRYISAVSGILFERDINDPDIYRPEGDVPGNIGIIIGSENTPDKSSSSIRQVVLRDDPIERILDRLTLKANLGGPNRPVDNSSSLEGSPLSRSIGVLIDGLVKAGLISRPESFKIWPNGKRFGAAITHDIDIARRSIRGGIRLLFQNQPSGRLKGLVDTLKSAASGRPNPYDQVSNWIDAENQSNVPSTFFIFAGPRDHADDPKYGLKDLKDSMRRLAESGLEIALHTGIECKDGHCVLESRKALEDFLNISVTGVRPHYLSANLPAYWRAASQWRLEYSSCLGFDDKIGYYAGVDLPIIPYDTDDDSPIDLVEIPIAIMDCGLIGDDRADSPEVMERGRNIIDRTAESGGLVVLDWHQRTLYDPDYPGWGTLFLEMLRYLIEKGAHFDTMNGIARRLKKQFGRID